MDAKDPIVCRPLDICFDEFCAASSFEGILSTFYRLCDVIDLKCLPGCRDFFRELRQRLSSYWKSEALLSKLDARFNKSAYGNQPSCQDIRVIVVGCGPCGLRSAIELALLGANVVVVEKRSTFSRNNVLHLWPYLISDLKSLGAKTFFGKFCAGSIDHISIRALQCILLKVALLFGVQIVPCVVFQKLIEPSDDSDRSENSNGLTSKTPLALGSPPRELFTLFKGPRRARLGWRAKFSPHHEALSTFEFDVIVDAAGKSSSCLNFPRKALRCRLAIAITVNFINYGTVEEAHIEEISGVASIFNQAYFAQISRNLGLDLENLVYYKDETHYFVMTVRKKSLLSKGVLIRDFDDPVKLLRADNIDSPALERLARDVATFATKGKLTRLDFAPNSHGQPDIAVFDFTSLSAAEYACRVIDRKGRPLCQCLVGDALIEPFWPRGSGCALGFFSAMDAAWAVSLFAAGHHALRVIAWRDSIYQRLSQTSPSNMPPNFSAYTFQPTTRYTCVDLELVQPMQVRNLYDSDIIADMSERESFAFLRDSVKFYNSDLCQLSPRSAINKSKFSYFPHITILRWYQTCLSPYPVSICPHIVDFSAETWSDGRALRCLVNKYRPDLVSEEALKAEVVGTCEGVMHLLAEHFGAPKVLDLWRWPEYLSALYSRLKGHKPAPLATMTVRTQTRSGHRMRRRSLLPSPSVSGQAINRCIDSLASPQVSSNARRGLSPRAERRALDIQKIHKDLENPVSRVKPPRAREDASRAVEKGLMSRRRSEFIAMLNDPASAKRRSLMIDWEKAFEDAGLPLPPSPPRSFLQLPIPTLSRHDSNNNATSVEKIRDLCVVCKGRLDASRRRVYDGLLMHPWCFRCAECQTPLRPEIAHRLRRKSDPKFYCDAHFHALTSTRVADQSTMSAENPPLPNPRGHNSPNRLNGPPNQQPPSVSLATRWDSHNSDGTPTTAAHTEGLHQTVPPHRQVRGIRDEPAPPVLVTSRNVSGTLGMPECVRRAAFDERLYRLIGHSPLEKSLDLLSENTSQILATEDNCFASSEYEPSECSTSSSSSSKTSDPPPINVEEASRLCRSIRAEALYRRNHPSEDEQSSSDEEESDGYSDCDPAVSDTFDTPQQVSDYENVRWTLARPPLSPTTAAENASTAEPSALVLKYGLSGSLLLAKQRFCMEAPEPIRIDSRAFRASKNKERTEETSLPDCSEKVEFILDFFPICASLTNSCSFYEVVEFYTPINWVVVSPQICLPSHNFGVTVHHSPVEMMFSSLSLAPHKPDSRNSLTPKEVDSSDNMISTRSELGSVTSHDSEETLDSTSLVNSKASLGVVDQEIIDASTGPSKVIMNTLEESLVPCKSSNFVREGAVMCVKTADALESLVLCDFDHEVQSTSHSPVDIDASAVRSECTMTTSSSEEEESDELVFLRRPVVVPPAELSTQLRENIEEATRQTRVPLYILTSQLDSDGDEHP
ncbi:unnamed protein product, partial [Mesocestoides corti]|uniref:LIM zinc-binding domain-containing protein n=3 Tax=Mesocestoides corti TaxID=53468 RepID=A0A158QT14_MESCO